MFKVYKRKIHVWREKQEGDFINSDEQWIYWYSTNAYPTCKAAVEAAKAKHPNMNFKASFAKD